MVAEGARQPLLCNATQRTLHPRQACNVPCIQTYGALAARRKRRLVMGKIHMSKSTESPDRRSFVATLIASFFSTAIFACSSHAVAQAARVAQEKAAWVDQLTGRRTLSEPLSLLRFADAVYVLTKPIAWTPIPGHPYKRVEVPVGFVTDFASVPRAF